MFDEWAVGREVEVGIVGLHIGRAVVIDDTYEKYQLDIYIYDLGRENKTNLFTPLSQR
jgi:hypothetical protein